MKKYILLFVFGLMACFSRLDAQIKTPSPSPTCKINQEVGLVKVDIEYSRPSARGRKVFGDLVPFGELWRTGANASTKISFSDDVNIGGTTLPAKQYALYTIPGATEWTVIFYKDTKYWGVPGEEYREDEVAAKIVVKPLAAKEQVESFSISLENLRNASCDLVLAWETTRIVVPLKFDTDAKVLADIKTQMEGPSSSTYYQAARYYFEEKKDMNQALDWVNKALEKGGEKFWVLQLKGKILAALGQYQAAIVAAERSTEIARKEGNNDYPRANEKLIAEWRKR